MAADFAVMEEMPFDRKRLRSCLKVRRIGRAEIKIRGLQLDPESLSRQLKLDGDKAATILIYRGDHQARAIVAQRLRFPGFGAIARIIHRATVWNRTESPCR